MLGAAKETHGHSEGKLQRNAFVAGWTSNARSALNLYYCLLVAFEYSTNHLCHAFLIKFGSLDLQKLLTAKGKALKACKYFVSAISEPRIEIPMTSFYYVVSFDEKKSEHEESKTPPQRRMSLLHIWQKRFMKSHLKYSL